MVFFVWLGFFCFDLIDDFVVTLPGGARGPAALLRVHAPLAAVRNAGLYSLAGFPFLVRSGITLFTCKHFGSI